MFLRVFIFFFSVFISFHSNAVELYSVNLHRGLYHVYHQKVESLLGKQCSDFINTNIEISQSTINTNFDSVTLEIFFEGDDEYWVSKQVFEDSNSFSFIQNGAIEHIVFKAVLQPSGIYHLYYYRNACIYNLSVEKVK